MTIPNGGSGAVNQCMVTIVVDAMMHARSRMFYSLGEICLKTMYLEILAKQGGEQFGKVIICSKL